MVELSIVIPVRKRNISLAGIDNDYIEIIPVHYQRGLWNISRAANIGIKRSRGEIVAKVDADIVLPKGFIDDVLGAGHNFCVAPVKRLEKGHGVGHAGDYEAWGDLSARYWPCGGWQSAPREFWFDIHGYDEDMILYGAEDTDMWNRAKSSCFKPVILDPIVHLWHKVQAYKYAFFHMGNVKLRESRMDVVVRNRNGWGNVIAPRKGKELTRWLLNVTKVCVNIRDGSIGGLGG